MKINNLSVTREGGEFVVNAALDAYFDIFRDDLEQAQKKLSKKIGVPVRLRVSVRRAYLFDIKPPQKKSESKIIRSVDDAVREQELSKSKQGD